MLLCMETNFLWSIWNKHIPIKKFKYNISGFSVASLRTNFYIKELNIMLDAGMSSPLYPDHGVNSVQIYIVYCPI